MSGLPEALPPHKRRPAFKSEHTSLYIVSNSQAQKLWDRIVAHGKAGAKAKAKKKAERALVQQVTSDPKGESQGRNA